ncbi:hypothetical protein JAAARDRAFT_141290 [Jaapia argillacea MUCL 33604]|uniref:BTB domain-containing protein n=1 Tax=Jaapia argillacea MUCL 33604 TaxID=933084 RepID=A0A067PIQ7_9AGAM|nr:hypothetical protein JAAARDRAFT_141290 [Jaapia argillacea MUCL 33604]
MTTADYNTYYFQDVIFLVEDQLFKVPRLYFENHSDVFRDMFRLPVERGVDVEGSSDENPLRLEGIKKVDFLRLLRVMYPRLYSRHDITTYEEWSSILELSSMWNFEEIKDLAIENLSSSTEQGSLAPSPVTRILLGQKYDVPLWVAWGVTDLVKRSEPLTIEEAQALGMESTLKIARVRENHRPGKCNCDRFTGGMRPPKEGRGAKEDVDFSELVVGAFNLNRREVEESERRYKRVLWEPEVSMKYTVSPPVVRTITFAGRRL